MEGEQTKIRDIWRKEPFRSLIILGIIVLLFFTFRTALILTLKTEYPLMTPISESMEPTLHIGDLLIVQGIDPKDVKVGDIIVFRKPINRQELVVHRVVEIHTENNKYYFTTKGDKNRDSYYWEKRIPEDCLIGKVIGAIPLLGYVKIYFGTPVGMAIGIILIATLLILEALPSKKDKEPSKNEPEDDASKGGGNS